MHRGASLAGGLLVSVIAAGLVAGCGRPAASATPSARLADSDAAPTRPAASSTASPSPAASGRAASLAAAPPGGSALKPSLKSNPAAFAAKAASPALKAAPAKPNQKLRKGTFKDETISVGDLTRRYRLAAPQSLEAGKPIPLVFAFHGLGDSKDLMPWYSRLDDLAAREGFLLVYPDGRNRSWILVKEWAAADFDFFDALLAKLSAEYPIDPDRVYLVGMSNGAYFAQLLASQRSDKIAAVAAHSGGLGQLAFEKKLSLERKYGVFLVHGADDSIVPVAEGRRARDQYKKWGFDVEYVEVPGWNHFWAHKIDVNAKIWKFFLGHPRAAEAPRQAKRE